MTIRYTHISALPDAIKAWAGKPLNSLPADMAPCGYLPGVDEENRVLADIFAKLCALPTNTERMGFLMAAIERHKRYVRLYESTVRGESNPRMVGANASREAWARIRPIQAMIEALEQWRDDLLDAWSAEIGVGFLDQAARRSA